MEPIKVSQELEEKVRQRTAELEKTNEALRQEIQKRQEVEANLRESEDRYVTLAATVPVGIFRNDAAGNCIYVNDRWCEIAGLTFQEALNNGWVKAIHPDHRDRVLTEWLECVVQGNQCQTETPIECADGTIKWVYCQSVAQKNLKGEIIGYVGTVIDITERKQTVEALQQLNRELELRVEQRTDQLTKLNQQLIEEIAQHRETEKALNLQIERLRQLYNLVVALNQAETIPEIFQIAVEGIQQTLKSDRAGLLTQDPQGKISYPASIGISDAYKQSLEEYLEFWNSQLGSDFIIIPNQENEREVNLLEALRQSEGIRSTASFPLCYKNRPLGKLIVYYNTPHHFQTDEIQLAKTIATYVAAIITRKRGEEALRDSNEKLSITNGELARATRLKDEFLASMSHELRTPLNTILGMSEGLEEEVFGSLNNRQVKAIATIARSGKHLLELINDILDLSKIEAGKLELQLTNISVRNLCESSLTFVKLMALNKNIVLSANIPDDIGKIHADDRRMQQVLINLLSNAVKFTPNNGSVILRVRREEQFLVFEVEDTGIGIAPENMGKLFQSFVQIDSSLSRQYSGTGLGLSLVRRLVELHGGNVNVESEVGKGSCFIVTVPHQRLGLGAIALRCSDGVSATVGRLEASAPILLPQLGVCESLEERSEEQQRKLSDSDNSSTAPIVVVDRETKPPVILFAEDNQANIDTISDYLIGRGYRLLLANNGQDVISIAKERKPDLILMDIQMPQIDGLEATRQIRADSELANIPIIALTALAMSGDREKCIEAGASEYLTKPVRLKQLTRAIEQLLNR